MDDISATWKLLIAVLVVWDLIWKGLALWRAGRNNHAGWFVAILLINSAGILPIIYLVTHRHESASDKISDG